MAGYIVFDQVTKSFGRETVLHNVSFSVEQGSICGLVGRNGSGKTVIFKLLTGFMRPTQGTITVGNVTVSQSAAFLPSVGVLIEAPGFIPHYSGLKNLKVLNDLSPKRVSVERLCQTMALVGLDPKSHKAVKHYSLGMTQKLGIAQALMHQPELLVLDEPMNGLDEQSVSDMRMLLKACQQEGTTILLSSHNREDIEALCTTLYTIRDGTMTAQSLQEVAP